ncbi:hypothetical protein E0M25_09500 [Bacillus mycoides]|nr:hypothetical protein EXW30_16350 [Bacillus mycoides]QWH12883.1 hypothetical protein EXW38_16695 [Bacillus mycoides]TBX79439.1 hypothetical protein E0M25_09500 [Bacillus mycoides]
MLSVGIYREHNIFSFLGNNEFLNLMAMWRDPMAINLKFYSIPKTRKLASPGENIHFLLWGN